MKGNRAGMNKKSPRGGQIKPRPPKGLPVNVAKRPIPPIVPIEEEEEAVHEPPPEEPAPEPKEDSWLNHLPPVIKPDEELHKQLSHQRREQHNKKVRALCSCELDGIFSYAFEFMKHKDDTNFIDSTKYRSLRTKYRNGQLTPELNNIKNCSEKLTTLIEPCHTLAIQHYLHFQSDSYLKDLSCAFGTEITSSHLSDPNPIFNELLQRLHGSSQVFINSYHPYDLLQFPYIVCIGGPVGSGRTTIAQFLQKSFDAHFIDVKSLHPEGSKKPKKQATQELEPTEPVPEFHLKNSISIRYTDDKNAVQEIVQTIKDNMDGRGFIIDGYPNQKNQFSALDKALGAAGVNMHQYQVDSNAPPISQRQKAALPSIDGMIIAANNEPNRIRLVDPETGNIYKEGFHMPGLPDLIGVLPIDFLDIKKEIEGRLTEITVPEIPVLAPKALQAYAQYEAFVKKSSATVLIKHCDDLIQFLEAIDSFLVTLYKKLPHLIPNKPMTTLVRPTCLIKPELCFNAITTWYKCLEYFGRTIADQSSLVSTLDNKLGVIIKAGTERYQLLIGQKDQRLKLCEDFMEARAKVNSNINMAQHFRTIWDLSLKIRNENLEKVDDVVGRSGLVELLLELRKSPKIVFIALVQRMLYIKWFDETFQHLESMDVDESTESPFFQSLDVEKTNIPIYLLHSKAPVVEQIISHKSDPKMPTINSEIPMLDLQFSISSAKFPQTAKAVKPPESSRPQSPRVPLTARRNEDNEKKERRMMASIRGFDYLVENLNYFCEKPQDTALFFDLNKACAALDVIPFEIKSSFDDTAHYAEEFFFYMSQHLCNQLLINETKSSLTIFNRFMKLCKTKEASMVNSVFDLRDALNNYTYQKCTHEMEYFARQFRILKQNSSNNSYSLESPLFEYDIKHINKDIQELATYALTLDTPLIAQSLISAQTMLKIGKEMSERNLLQASVDDFLNAAKEVDIDKEEMMRFEYCMRVMECVEHFDVKLFLLCFAHDRENEMELMEMFRNVTNQINDDQSNLNDNIQNSNSQDKKIELINPEDGGHFSENDHLLTEEEETKEGECSNTENNGE